MSIRTTLVTAACSLALVAAGCGGGDDSTTEASDGKTIFTDSGCGGCHTLADAGAEGRVGPDLDDRRPDVETVRNKVENGGGGMPSFGGRLTDAQIDAVAEYVAGAAGK